MGIIFNIQRYCLHDGDGIRTNVFFKGCPLRCIWCHNPEGLTADISVSFNSEKCTLCGRCLADCAGREIKDGRLVLDRSKCTACNKCVDNCLTFANELLGKSVTAQEVIDEVLRDKIYYKTSGGGMTLSGGEPSSQPSFALELIRKAAEHGISTCIETCGIGSRDFYQKAFDLSCTFLFDLKCMDPERHRELTGADNDRIISNLEYLFELGADIVIRIPLIPGINDTEDDISALCDFLIKHKGKYRYAEIMPYHTFGISKAKRIGKEDIYVSSDATADDKSRWKEAFLKKGLDVKISE